MAEAWKNSGGFWGVSRVVAAAVGAFLVTSVSLAGEPVGGGAGAAKPAVPHPAQGPGRHKVEVDDVLSTDAGQFVVVLKTHDTPRRLVPIWIGESEALSIRMRMDRYNPPRPLTLNLLEAVLRSSQIQVREVSIDDVRGGVFFGTLRLEQQGRTWTVDARPSDAIGLALGGGAPIWISHSVLEGAALLMDSLAGPDDLSPEGGPSTPTTPGSPSSPFPPRVPGTGERDSHKGSGYEESL